MNLSIKTAGSDSPQDAQPLNTTKERATNLTVRLGVLLEAGSGRSFLVVGESHQEAILKEVGTALALKSRVVVLRAPQIGDNNLAELLKQLRSEIETRKYRQLSVVSFSATNALALSLYLEDPKLLRTLVLVNATTRPHPSKGARFVEKIEQILPLGLPLRSEVVGFDAKPYLQRVRCPVLVITTAEATRYEQAEAGELSKRLPTAWQLHTTSAAALVEAITEFQEVQAKCPQ